MKSRIQISVVIKKKIDKNEPFFLLHFFFARRGRGKGKRGGGSSSLENYKNIFFTIFEVLPFAALSPFKILSVKNLYFSDFFLGKIVLDIFYLFFREAIKKYVCYSNFVKGEKWGLTSLKNKGGYGGGQQELGSFLEPSFNS